VPNICLYKALMKLESDKRVVCDGSCSECPRCLRLYRPICIQDSTEGMPEGLRL